MQNILNIVSTFSVILSIYPLISDTFVVRKTSNNKHSKQVILEKKPKKQVKQATERFSYHDIEALINSNNYLSWNKAALSDEITSSQLLKLAKKCAEIRNSESCAKTLATSICNNKNATDNIVNQLTKSCYYAVLNIIAESDYSDKVSLFSIAKECAKINNSESWAKTITNSILENPNVNSSIINELTNSIYYPVLNIVAQSELCDTIVLTNVAKECAKINNSKYWPKTIATSISKNPNVNDSIISQISSML